MEYQLRTDRPAPAVAPSAGGWLARPDSMTAPPESPPCGAAPVSLRQPTARTLDARGPEQVAALPIEALALAGVSHRFGKLTALDDVTLTLGAGEIVCLVGPSGCGKSTLLRLAAGLERLQGGVVRVGGRVVADAHGAMPPERRGIGLVFQDYALFPHLTVLDNVRFGLRHLPAAARRSRALACLRQVGMDGYAGAYPHVLSGGQQQRVALARALAPQPAVLLLDEPFSGLDARLRQQVRDETLHVLKRSGAATLVVTHDPEEAMFLADRIVLMREGRVVQTGCPVDLYARPVNGYAASFFGEVNRFTGQVRRGGVDTPVGFVAVPEAACSCCYSNDATVEVLIRPEGLRLEPPAGGAGAALPNLARVEAARLLGRTSLIHLSMPDGHGGIFHLHARVAGPFLPAEDSQVAVTLDRRQAFVFPLTPCEDGGTLT
ncbi:MAG: ATP-binding cassette domain-containing protein [Azospirillum sp.]|nr:ATP-binding cassette domain-containing protein [Azospirillum sp.]